VALNRAGNSSVEYLLRVIGAESPRDAPATGSREQQWLAQQQPARDQRAPASQQEPTAAGNGNRGRNPGAQEGVVANTQPAANAPPSSWLRGSTSFQVTMVIVSALMGAVVVAFLLFCVLIYQIKPPTMAALKSEAKGPLGGATLASGDGNEFGFGPPAPHLAAVCNPNTGLAPMHLLARPAQTPAQQTSSQPLLYDSNLGALYWPQLELASQGSQTSEASTRQAASFCAYQKQTC